MADFPFDIVGFDLDGTLLDTSIDLAGAVNHALALIARAPLPVAQVMTMVGGGMRLLLERALTASGGADPETLERLYPALVAYYEAHMAEGTRAYPGLVDALEALAARGVGLAVVTNKLEALAVKLIGETGLAAYFPVILGGDTLGPGNAKPSGAPVIEMIRRCGGGRAAFVGDSRYDVAAAQAAGVPSVAVAFGFTAQPAAELGADAVIDDYAALVRTLEMLGASQAGR